MNNPNQDYLKRMRERGLNDAAIRKSLADGGWLEEEITELFAAELAPPPAPHSQSTSPSLPVATQKPNQPIAVVQRYTTVGIEFAVMFLSLAFAAISLGVLLHSLVDNWAFSQNAPHYEDASLAGVTALVTIPIFLVLFFRLKRQEKANSAVHTDASRRKGVQLTLLVSFVWGIGTLVYYLYGLVNSFSGGTSTDLYSYDEPALSTTAYQIQQLCHALITLVIAGGIFAYYWWDEHRHQDKV